MKRGAVPGGPAGWCGDDGEVAGVTSVRNQSPGGLPANPLDNYATLNTPSGKDGSYGENDSLGLGVRIFGEPVPEPSTLTLLAAGLAGAVALQRRRRAAV